jgi:tetratricopeptide (TPR) repeat protein
MVMLAALSGTLGASTAFAGDAAPTGAPAGDDAFSALVKTGMDAFQNRRYDEAIKSFKAAYAMKQEPELLYNIGRVYERAGQIDDAIQAYKDFIAAPGTTSALRSKALDNVNSLSREKQAREQASQTPRSDPARASGGGSAGAAGSAKTEAPKEHSTTAQWALVGGGAAAVVVGAVFGVIANGNKNDFDSSTVLSTKISARDDGQRNAAISTAAMAVGGVAIIGGIVWMVLGGDSGPAESAALLPTFTSNGFAVGGVF